MLLLDVTTTSCKLVALGLVVVYIMDDESRTYVDPIATPNPDAILADLQPFPDLNSNTPNVPPISIPAVIFITPSSMWSSIPFGNFQFPTALAFTGGGVESDAVAVVVALPVVGDVDGSVDMF